MPKVCIIYNFAQHYRESIYKLIDKEWDCKWFFGKNQTDIKGISDGCLKDVSFVDNKKLIGPLWYQTIVGRLISRKDIDHFILLGEPFNLSTWWILIQRRLFFKNKKVYLWSHGWYGKEGLLKKLLKRVYFGMADHIFTYGEYAKKLAIAQGFDENKISPIHNSLDHSIQNKLRDTLKPSDIYRDYFKNYNPTIIFIGRLTEVKRLDLLLDGIKVLKERGYEYNVVFVGTGVMEDTLKIRARNMGLEKQLWFYGASYDDQINAELIFNADMCVSPGNVGLTAMHTMVFGTPVLTHDDFKWQMPEFEAIKPNVTGAFFKKNNVISIADTIQNWMIQHPNRNKVRQACYDEIDNNWTPEYQLAVLKRIISI